MSPDPSLPASLSARVLDSLRPLAAGYGSHGLLDFPSHGNVGDSAIWLGEVAVLDRLHGCPPAHVSHCSFAADAPGRVLPGGLIYLHGGGNFGDIWPRHQLYREAVIARHPDHRIIQLPQSLHFRTPAAIERARRVIGGHRDFHLMVRDRESLEFSTQHFDCPVCLVPDSAFCIDTRALPRRARPEGILCLLRTDQERRADAGAGARMFGDAAVADWARGPAGRAGLERAMIGLLRVGGRMPGLAGWSAQAFTGFARDRVMLGFAQLDAAAVVVTDRLHGHIMARLLGKPHVVIDNFYGKIANFIRAWGKDDITLQARDYAEAAEMAQSLLARQGAA